MNQGATAPDSPRRVLLDCTRTYRNDVKTGIPRVVRNIANSAQEVGRALGLECCPVVFHAGVGFVGIQRLPPPGTSPPPPLPRARRAVARSSRFQEWAKRTLGRFGLIEPAHRLHHALEQATFAGLRPIRRLTRRRGIQFRPGDVLLLLDASWNVPFWDDVQSAQQRGAQIGVVVYDLLPLRRSEFFGETCIRIFRQWWTTAAEVADFCVCISQTVWQDVQAIQREERPRRRQPLVGGSFRLGAELDRLAAEPDIHDDSTSGMLRPDAERIFSEAPDEPVYLVVGTFDPRKNQVLVLDAFDRLWSQDARIRLLLAGKYGRDSEDLVERVKRHPQSERRLFWRSDLRDGELKHCYRRAAGLITASHDEGFNLPIVEALHHGCPVLASDVPVHREVGSDYAAYFPLGNPAALAELVAAHQRRGTLSGVRSPETFRWLTWGESCRELLTRIQEMYSLPLSRRPASAAGRRAA